MVGRHHGGEGFENDSITMPVSGSAEFVIVGGGAMGCGIAHALAQFGKTDIVIIERRDRLAQGTTSQGAGLCGQVRTTPERTRLAMHSARTFKELEAANAPVKPGWNEVGSLRIASTEARVQELRRLAQVCAEAGLEVELIDPARAQRLWPKLNFSGVLAALWCPTDGYMSPAQVTNTYEYYCLEHGVRFLKETAVESIELNQGRVVGVKTNRGSIHCRCVINAAGPSAYRLAKLVGLELPIVPLRHQYFVTEPIVGLSPTFPVLRIPETGLYARVDGNGLLLGGWEENCVSMNPAEIDASDGVDRLATDWNVLKTFAQRFEPLLPEVVSAGTARVAKGWPTFTPDGRFIVGESTRIPGFVMAGGCNAHGISGSPGLGQAFVEAMFSPNPSPYVQSLSPARFEDSPWTWQSAREQAESLCRNYYEMVLFDAKTEGEEVRADREHRFDRGGDGLPQDIRVHAPVRTPETIVTRRS